MDNTLTFSDQAQEVTSTLRASLAGVVNALPGPIENQTALQKMTKMSAGVSWAIYHAATSSNPVAAGLYVPKRSAMQTFLGAARRLGVPEERVSTVQSHFDDFERFIKEHAGDWESFEMMVSDLAGERSETMELKQRRTAFRANRHLCGSQVACVYSSTLFAPSPKSPGRCDFVSIGGCIGIRQLRGQTEILARNKWRITDADGTARRDPPEPIFPGEVEPAEAALVPLLCSNPLPRFQINTTARGYRELILLSTGLGATYDASYGFGRIYRDAVPAPTPDDPLTAVASVQSPTKVLVRDLVVHNSLLESSSVSVKSYATNPSTDILELTDTHLTPDQPSIEPIGRGIAACTSSDCPNLEGVVSVAMDRMGWDTKEFQVYRCRVEYPMLSSVVRTYLTKD